MGIEKEVDNFLYKMGLEPFYTPDYLKVGISESARTGLMPINGLRHPPSGNTSGWYIWAGEDYSDDPNFFVPLHIKHLNEWCPEVLKFLHLPPGVRFLFDNKGYTDIWQDNSLLL